MIRILRSWEAIENLDDVTLMLESVEVGTLRSQKSPVVVFKLHINGHVTEQLQYLEESEPARFRICPLLLAFSGQGDNRVIRQMKQIGGYEITAAETTFHLHMQYDTTDKIKDRWDLEAHLNREAAEFSVNCGSRGVIAADGSRLYIAQEALLIRKRGTSFHCQIAWYCSDYFKALFDARFMDSQQEWINLPLAENANLLRTCLKYSFPTRASQHIHFLEMCDHFERGEAMELLLTADQFGMDRLLDELREVSTHWVWENNPRYEEVAAVAEIGRFDTVMKEYLSRFPYAPSLEKMLEAAPDSPYRHLLSQAISEQEQKAAERSIMRLILPKGTIVVQLFSLDSEVRDMIYDHYVSVNPGERNDDNTYENWQISIPPIDIVQRNGGMALPVIHYDDLEHDCYIFDDDDTILVVERRRVKTTMYFLNGRDACRPNNNVARIGVVVEGDQYINTNATTVKVEFE